ncbi:general transcription factor IIH subunit 4 [Octopus bimaculoides]|uniref:General transcription factor IIH subunit 4 n=1 Tax=Octopus bimaculoides TaxID=37653 RepID=A0A0L8G4D3_OCTBM|nr:general transcription factor IIH subunit 4 [Octopus bimaculoides]|eukprot:XP_014784318.1 PREDICTED: general transcription factor IIH subunit 4-like [Octopus bimaculoides]
MSATLESGKLECKDLYGYLRTLPANVLDKLYNHPATCLAVFRELPELAKHCVMRILFVEQPVPQAVVAHWVANKHHEEQKQAMTAVTDLRVWHEQPLPGGMMGFILNQTFRMNMKTALLGGGQPWTGGGSLPPDKHVKDIAFLDNYAQDRWECVLHFMVGSSDCVSRDIKWVLLHAGLMKAESEDQAPVITPNGFQFLLMDTSSQVWFFMLQYLNTLATRGMDLVESLSFLFQLSFSIFGKDYTTEGMSEAQLRLLQHLREFGLVYQRKRKSQRYYPTKLAINLAAGLSQVSDNAIRQGFIVVETNYRVYAYTDSQLQIALLALFTEMIYRFPNMVVGQITRDSVRSALSCGISADQIIHFLKSHAHEKMLEKMPVIPPTVTDQIHLWELERDRFKFTDGVLYNQFLSQSDFELLRDYARDLGVLVWDKPSKRVMVVARNGHDEVKRFWKRQKHS